MERKLALLSFFSGIFFGYISIIVTNLARTTLISFVVIGFYMLLIKIIFERLNIVEKKPFKWWFSKFYGMFILFWFIFWTIFYNIV